MSFRAGQAGQKTELLDGVKVDVIDEYTAGAGAVLKGRTNGTAIPSGYVGDTVTGTYRAVTAVTSGWTNSASAVCASILPGVYIMTIYAYSGGASGATGFGIFPANSGGTGFSWFPAPFSSGQQVSIGANAISGDAGICCGSFPVTITAATGDIYARSKAIGANQTITFNFSFVRIA